MEHLFKWHENKPLQVMDEYSCCPLENLYQAFKTRFIEEQKMTPEEFAEWKDKMVRK